MIIKMKIVFFYVVMIIFAEIAKSEQNEDGPGWGRAIVSGQVEGTCLWYRAISLQNKAKGEFKNIYIFGFKEKGENTLNIKPILCVSGIINVPYTWEVIDQVLVVKMDNQVIVKLELKLLEELAKRDKNLETSHEDEGIKPVDVHVDLDTRKS